MNPNLKLKISLIVFIIVISFGSGIAQIKPLVVDCTVNSISPTSLNAGSGAGQVSPIVSVSTLNSCTTYTVSNSNSWISYTKNLLNVTITVQANTGSARTGYVYIGSNTLTVNQACGNFPGAAGAITGSHTVCQNQTSVNYNVATISGATGYLWSLPTGATIASGNNTNSITVNYSSSAVSGNITVRGTNSCGYGAVSPNYSVTVNAAPSQPGSISGQTSVCSGSTYTYSISTVPGASSYSWTLPSGASGTSSTNSINVTFGSNSGNISVSAINSAGCISTPRSLTVTISTITLYNVTGGVNSICPGSQVPIGLSGSANGVQYQCYLNNVYLTSTYGNGSAISFGNQGSAGTYSVKGVSSVGCLISMNGNASISLRTPSTAPTSINASPASICPGSSSTLSVVGGSLEPNYGVWKWYSGSCGSILVGQGSSVTVNPNSTATYFVRAEGGCLTTSCASNTVTVKQLPSITIQPVNATISLGQDATFSITATGSNLQYQWQSALSTDGPWTDLSSLPAMGYTTSTLTIKGSSTFSDVYYRCAVTGDCFMQDWLYSNAVKINLSFPTANYLTSPNIPDPETRQLETNFLVGTTNGSFNIDAAGGAYYTISLDVPPGVNNLTPSISVSYSSNSGNGIPGYGWRINGIPAISNGPETYYNDSYLPKEDRYFLNGQRLNNNSPNEYNSANAIYQPEINDFTRVTPQDVNYETHRPKWFKAETKPGFVYEYGNSLDSRQQISDANPVLIWYVSKIKDAFNNQISFSYLQDHYCLYPSEISYGPNKINFYYKQRSDISIQLLSSGRIEQMLLLDRIVIKYNSSIIKTYEFRQSLQGSNYNTYSALNEIIEYGTNTSRLNSTVLAYKNPNNVSFTQTTYNTTNDYLSYKSKLVTGDFNGDGKTDFLCLPDSTKTTWTGIRIFAGLGNDNFNLLINNATTINLGRLRDIRAIDINGDGIDDIVYEYGRNYTSSTSDFYYMICNGQSLGQRVFLCTRTTNSHTGMTGKIRRNGLLQEDNNERLRINVKPPYFSKDNINQHELQKTGNKLDCDLDGDGLNEILINDPTGHIQAFKYLNNAMTSIIDQTFLYGFFSSDVLEGDFNGDGRTDLWTFTPSGLGIYDFDIDTGYVTGLYNSTWPTDSHYFVMGDFNGDGKIDLFLYGWYNNGTYYDWGTWQIHLSNGTSFEEHDVPRKKYNLLFDNLMIGDFNGDGSTDLMVTSKDQSWTGSYFYISSNNSTDFYVENLSSFPTTRNNFYLSDFDGDGRTDFICTDVASNGWDYKVFKSPGNNVPLINRMANGLGVVTKIAYTKLTQAPSSIYQKESNASFPVYDFQGPWNVVDTVWEDNGRGSKNAQTYYYQGAKIHSQGKGFLGYSKTNVTDLSSGIKNENISDYDRTYYYPILLKSIICRAGTTDTINVTRNIWSALVDGYIQPYIVYPYVQNSYSIDKLTGLSNSSSYQYDYYGNPSIITKDFLNGPTVTIINTYYNIIENGKWLLGRPISSIIQYAKTSTPTIIRSVSRVYDQNSNNLFSETWYSGTGNQITKAYAYNSNGTIKRDSVTVNSISRSNSCTYESDYIRIHTSTDQLSHITTNSYDNYGRLYTQQDYLGNTATYQYDALGRETSVSLSDGSQATTVYSWEDPASDPVLARYSVLKTGNDGSQTKSWFDKLGRDIRTGVKGFDGTMIYTSTVYNTKGQVESVSDPYYSNGTALLNTFLYDTYGRKTSQTRPSGRNTTWAYNSNTITETTAGKSFSKTYASDGTISSATDAGGTIAYSYYNDGKVKTITAPGGIVTSMQYDPAGNQNQLVDPSAGTLTYTYNGFGELTYQQNAKAQTTQLTYLPDGRPDQKILSVEGTTTYSYNSNKQLTGISSPGNVIRSYVYDGKGRIKNTNETIPGSSPFTTHFGYDNKGRIDTIIHPSGIVEIKNYNSNGYLNSVSTGGVVRWTTTAMNARQQVTSGQYWQSGGNLSAAFGYDTYGYPTSTVVGTIQNYSYNFNPVTGNLNWRQNNKYSSLREDFQYDNLDRLSNISMGSITTLSMGYDNNKGGIISKSDAGTLLYGNSQYPYAVSSINPTTGLTPSATQTITYTSFESVNTISENSYNASFIYNSDNQRAKMVVNQGTGTILTRWYSIANYIKETAGSVTKEYTFIGGDSYTAPVVAITQSGTTTYYNILRDYLGNITHVVNATTGAITEYSFDAWGRMRNPSTWVNYAPGSEPVLFIAGRGFTGHEHLPWFNLINMNGRVYDALIGMFLSPDNYVQNPDLTQNFNRYGYCLNNPLKYIDPSGYSMEGPDPWGAYIRATARGYTGGYGSFSDQYYDQYYDYQFSSGGGGFSGGGGGGVGGGSTSMTFTWHTWNDHNEVVNGEVHVTSEKINHSVTMQIPFGGNANNISNAGLQFIGQHEGYSSTVYNDAAGKPTIGYGHLIKPGEYFNSITKPQGLQLLKNDASLAVNAVNKNVTVPLTQNQFDALTSFTFNVGVGAFSGSSLLRNVNSGSIMLIENSFLMWNKARIDGVLTPVPGLTIRRQDEAGLYLYGY